MDYQFSSLLPGNNFVKSLQTIKPLAKNELILLSLILFGNFWIWRIIPLNFLVGVVVILLTYALYFSFKQSRYLPIFILLFTFAVFFQVLTTEIKSLILRDNDEQRVHQMRLKEYQPTYFKIGSKVIWIPDKYWLEQRDELFVFNRLANNFFENLDINLYFFGNHPRERLGISEFEKIPYTYLAFFIIGFFSCLKQRNGRLLLIFTLPLLLYSGIGNVNKLGPFLMLPFFALTIEQGLKNTLIFLMDKAPLIKTLVFVLMVILIVISQIQLFIYAST